MKRLVFTLGLLLGCSTDTFVGPDGATGDSGGSDVGGDETIGPDGGCTPAGITCAAGAICSSFDDNQGLGPFSNISSSGGNVTVTSDVAFTCPSALAAFAPAAGATGSPPRGGIGLEQQLQVPNAIVHARVELDAILPKAPTGSVSFLFMYANGDTAGGIGLVYANGTWVIHDAVTNDDVTVSPRTGVWSHLALDVTFAQSGGAGTVTFSYTDNNGQAQTAKMTRSTLNATVASSVAFGAGVIPTAVTSGPMTVHLDDVVFTPF